ncbi:permease [Myxococcota bacterium]|nr:permease [Myxococcota bacterium]MBU1537799.1 permease [Myxococcota bacterium]
MDTILLVFKNAWLLSVDMAPWLFLGFLMAGMLHALIPGTLIARHMGTNSLSSIIKASLIGMPLPICSCGVLPVATSLRQSGAAKGPTVSFLITTPVTGVDSIMATYALLGWFFALVRVLASLVIGFLAGMWVALTDRSKQTVTPAAPGPVATATSGQKLISIFTYGFRDLPITMAESVLLGIFIGGIITTLLPAHLVARYIGTGYLGLVVAGAVAVPLYVCATGSIPIALAMLVQGFSPGAALVFLIAGPATNAVAMTTVKKVLGTKALVIYLVSIFGGALVFGALFDAVLRSGVSVSMPAGAHHTQYSLFSLIAGALLLAHLLLLFGFSRLQALGLFNKRNSDTMAPDISLNVPDMTCNHCKMNVTKILQTVDGVENISVDLGSKVVQFDTSGAVKLEEIMDRLKAGGYEASRK